MLLGCIPLDTDLIGHGGRDDIQVLASESSLGDSNVQPGLGTVMQVGVEGPPLSREPTLPSN